MLPHEGGPDGNPINKTIQRGTSATIGESTTTVLDGNGYFQPDTSQLTSMMSKALPGSTVSPRVAYLRCRGYGGSCDGVERQRAVDETNVVQNRIKSRLTLPHLAKFQTYSVYSLNEIFI